MNNFDEPFRPKLLGELLVEAGLLTEEQLNSTLELQRSEPYRTFGDLVSTTFQIPQEMVEELFINKTLIPTIQQMLIQQLRAEEDKFTAKIPFQADQLLYRVDVTSITLNRMHSKTFQKQENGQLVTQDSTPKPETEIKGVLNIRVTTDNGVEVITRDKMPFEYDSDSQHVMLDRSLIDGMKFQFGLKNKESLGIDIKVQPLTDEDLRHLMDKE